MSSWCKIISDMGFPYPVEKTWKNPDFSFKGERQGWMGAGGCESGMRGIKVWGRPCGSSEDHTARASGGRACEESWQGGRGQGRVTLPGLREACGESQKVWWVGVAWRSGEGSTYTLKLVQGDLGSIPIPGPSPSGARDGRAGKQVTLRSLTCMEEEAAMVVTVLQLQRCQGM